MGEPLQKQLTRINRVNQPDKMLPSAEEVIRTWATICSTKFMFQIFFINVAISRQLRHSTDDELFFFCFFFVLVCCSRPSHGGHCVSSMSQ